MAEPKKKKAAPKKKAAKKKAAPKKKAAKKKAAPKKKGKRGGKRKGAGRPIGTGQGSDPNSRTERSGPSRHLAWRPGRTTT